MMVQETVADSSTNFQALKMSSTNSSSRVRWLTYLFSVTLLILVAACGADTYVGPNWNGVGVLGEYIMHDGARRDYVLHLPTSYDSSEATPLLIMLHGGVESGADFQSWNPLDSLANELDIMVAWPTATGSLCIQDKPAEECPQAPPYFWETIDIRFLRRLIVHLRSELYVDTSRIYAAGFSNGAVIAHEIACAGPYEFAGFAMISGPMSSQAAVDCWPSRPVPLLYMHGTEDRGFPWDGDLLLSVTSTMSGWVEVNGCSETPAIEWLPDTADDGTRVWTETYRDCDNDTDVLFYGIEGGGHTWPGIAGFPSQSGLTSFDIVANEVIVDFLLRQTKHP